MGADSAASLTNQGMVTAQQRSLKKLAANGRVISGIAGHVGLGQRIRAELENHLNSERWTGDKQAVLTQMRRHLWHNIVETEMRACETAYKALAHPSCSDSARTDTLVATVLEGRPELVHLDEKCAPTLIEDDLPFASIGLGQLTADPFLAFARRMLWPTGLPSLATGTFSVVWTLSHVIDANPNGIGDPIQLAVLEKEGSDWLGHLVPSSKVLEHRNMVVETEQALRERFFQAEGSPVAPPT